MRVPNISLLGLNLENLQAVYDASFDDRKVLKVRKTCRVQTAKTDTTAASSQPPGVVEHINWHAAWSEYVRGNVVSQAASSLIKSFLLHTLAATGAVHGDHESGSEGQEAEPDPDLPLCIYEKKIYSSLSYHRHLIILNLPMRMKLV